MSDGPILSKEALLKTGLPEEVVSVEGLGTVRIRSLSRAEYVQYRSTDQGGWETGLVAAGLVEPALTEDEVRDWRDAVGPKIFDDLAAEVLRVSGLRKVAEEVVAAVEAAKRNFPADS